MTKNILVIDDDKMLRDTLANGLRKAGFSTIKSESAEEAYQILSKMKFDAIVLDRMMTGQDGLSFLKQIRSEGNKTPVIMLTALSGSDNTIDGLLGGANDYMAKPFHFQELVLRLNNIIAQNQNNQTFNTMPDGLSFSENEFFIVDTKTNDKKLLALSSEEKKLLQNLVSPVGNTVSATPMVAKRLRNKINSVLSNIDIITVRGEGYKIITINKAVKK